ncbi:MAG: heme exporter protein CcmB [Schleiferiaceae bacterium]|nr:heme exporter protein CcmB [Schleiferiaceae bacterium]
MLKEIRFLIEKDLLLEFRQRFAFFSILLYVVATVYVSYLVFQRIEEPMVWNAVFWIILTFAALTTAGKSFVQESGNRFFFYYQNTQPEALILSKIVYNQFLMSFVGLFTWGFFSLLLGDVVASKGLFVLVLLLGSMGYASILTTLSAIAAKTGQNTTLMAVLSIPLLMPFLLILIKGSLLAIVGAGWEDVQPYMVGLVLLNAIVTGLGYLLFPYLWRE